MDHTTVLRHLPLFLIRSIIFDARIKLKFQLHCQCFNYIIITII